MNPYYFKFIRLRVLFGQVSHALTIVFCVDCRQDVFEQGLTTGGAVNYPTQAKSPATAVMLHHNG